MPAVSSICLIGHHVAPIRPPFAGGVESHTWYLARWLAARGHDVVLHAPPGSAVPGVDVRELALDEPVGAAARADVSMPPDAFMAAHHAYQRLMVDLAEDAEGFGLVHVNSLHYLPVAMAPTVRAPVLLTLHTPPTPWLESALRARPGREPTINAVSAATARLWEDVLDVDDVVPNGVDLAAWPAGPGGTGAVWAGRMVQEKAPHLAVEAAREAGLTLTLAGPVVDHDYFTAEVLPRLGAGAQYAGHLSHQRLARLLGSSAVALMTPTWEEPFGLAAAEAMACGTPVAAFARGGVGEVVGAEAGRLARPDDVEDLARAVREAAGLDRRAVRDYASRHLGIDAMGRGYERLYARLLAGRPALEVA